MTNGRFYRLLFLSFGEGRKSGDDTEQKVMESYALLAKEQNNTGYP